MNRLTTYLIVALLAVASLRPAHALVEPKPTPCAEGEERSRTQDNHPDQGITTKIKERCACGNWEMTDSEQIGTLQNLGTGPALEGTIDRVTRKILTVGGFETELSAPYDTIACSVIEYERYHEWAWAIGKSIHQSCNPQLPTVKTYRSTESFQELRRFDGFRIEEYAPWYFPEVCTIKAIEKRDDWIQNSCQSNSDAIWFWGRQDRSNSYVPSTPCNGALGASNFGDWNSHMFPGESASGSSALALGDDRDGDGMTNLMEYALGLNPWAPDTQEGLQYYFLDDHFTVEFSKSMAPTDLSIRVGVKSDLFSPWSYSELGNPTANDQVVFEEDNSDAAVIKTVRATDILNRHQASMRFYKLEAQLLSGSPPAVAMLGAASMPEFSSLAVSVSGVGSVSATVAKEACTDSCLLKMPVGGTEVLLAEPRPGYRFVAWGGDCSGDGICQVDSNSKKSVTAYFESEPVVEMPAPNPTPLQELLPTAIPSPTSTPTVETPRYECSKEERFEILKRVHKASNSCRSSIFSLQKLRRAAKSIARKDSVRFKRSRIAITNIQAQVQHVCGLLRELRYQCK